MKVRIGLAALGVVAVLVPSQHQVARADGQGGQQSLEPKHKTYELKMGEATFQFTLEETSANQSNGYWGGLKGSSQPHWFPSSFKVFQEEDDFELPRSSYADLTNVNSVKWSKTGETGTLTIVGGDASTSYTAVITVKKDWITRREVRNGEFPKNSFEVTTYTNIPIKG